MESGDAATVLAAPREAYTKALFEAAMVTRTQLRAPARAQHVVCLSFDGVSKTFHGPGGFGRRRKAETVVAADEVTFTVAEGEIVEYASNCADPIVHKAGDIRPEVFGTSHWWKNLGKETVILYVGDVRKDPHDHNM